MMPATYRCALTRSVAMCEHAVSRQVANIMPVACRLNHSVTCSKKSATLTRRQALCATISTPPTVSAQSLASYLSLVLPLLLT